MRDILFRGKTVSGRWAEGSLIHAGDYCCVLEDESKIHPMDYPYLDNDLGTFDGQATPVDPETVGQFTGLLDKDGKKIFEGDIVYNGVFKASVDFYNGRFIPFNGEYCTFFPSECEIIGNIYDNPKLVKH